MLILGFVSAEEAANFFEDLSISVGHTLYKIHPTSAFNNHFKPCPMYRDVQCRTLNTQNIIISSSFVAQTDWIHIVLPPVVGRQSRRNRYQPGGGALYMHRGYIRLLTIARGNSKRSHAVVRFHAELLLPPRTCVPRTVNLWQIHSNLWWMRVKTTKNMIVKCHQTKIFNHLIPFRKVYHWMKEHFRKILDSTLTRSVPYFRRTKHPRICESLFWLDRHTGTLSETRRRDNFT